MSKIRHYFPGNNTPLGFYSYYKYILGQREASKIICIKGGPGTGKSTFMKKIAAHFEEKDEAIDYLHCSADEESIDGVLLKGKKVAIIDGTSPHITDPLTPGAVDSIVNLGEYWNEAGITQNKEEIIDLNEETSQRYRIAYNYLNAAKSVYRSIEEIYNAAAESSEIYSVVAEIIAKEYGNIPISLGAGKVKKFFASALTANGVINYIPSLLESMKSVYLISVPSGFSNSSFMEIISEGAIYRGFDIEKYYCSICPEEKVEHLIIPKLGVAFSTINEYHDVEPWEICDLWENDKEIHLIDMNDYMNKGILDKNYELLGSLKEEFDILLGKSCHNLSKAKALHMKVEDMYVPNMNFTRVSALVDKIIDEIDEI